ncbi:MAG: Gfo/Idh/MocA family oxidoreductase, partial [Verrucomicrobiota bacterium]
SANNEFRVGCVGVGGMQGGSDVRSVSGAGAKVVALCDVDAKHLGKQKEKFPEATFYADYREMLDKEHKNLDGITITIPDHMHASVAYAAMQRGLHVYCQKPLTQTPWEARLLAKAAEKYKVITQMGNQGYSSEGCLRMVEVMWSGVLGDITEVHCAHRPGFAMGVKAWREDPVPEHLNWDLWLGRAQERPYMKGIHPHQWRGFLEFGSRMVGDWGVHHLGSAYWALNLKNPVSVECLEAKGANPVTYPFYTARVDFAERPHPNDPSKTLPPCSLYWREGMSKLQDNPPAGLTSEDLTGDTHVIGSKLSLRMRGRGNSGYIVPRAKAEGLPPPPKTIERPIGRGHFGNWVESCRAGQQALSSFGVAGPYTETLLMASISSRFPGQKLMWDSEQVRFTNNDDANEFVKPTCRKGWELPELKDV